jgi:polysaccharide pyruvyl transferase CsaB
MKIVVAGNYGAGNLGDELILEGIMKTLREVKPSAEITILSADPAKAKDKFEVRSLYKFPAGIRSFFKYLFNGNLRKTKQAVKECDFFILGGGGLFDTTSFKAILIWGIQSMAANFYKRPVIMYGQNISKLKSIVARKIVKHLFKKAAFIAVRDENSKEIVKDMMKGKKVYLMPDLIFKISPNHKHAKENKLLICLRENPNKKISKKAKGEFLNKIAEFTNKFLEKNKEFKVEFIPFEKRKDEQLNANLLEKIIAKDRVKIHPYTENKLDIERIFSEAKIVLGMRLHSTLMAINTATPFIAINYNPKVKNILSTLNLSEYLMEPGDITPENLLTLCEDILKNSEKIEENLKKIGKDQVGKFLDIELGLKKLLD